MSSEHFGEISPEDSCSDNKEAAYIVLEIGKLLSGERRWQQARKFFNQAVTFDMDNGDAWAHLIKFEQEQNEAGRAEELLKKMEEADPRHGQMWPAYFKRVENWNRSKHLTMLDWISKHDLKNFNY